MQLTNREINGFLYAIEGVGAVFVTIFIAVYLAGLSGLPRDVVYHSDPAIRLPLSIIGAVLVAMVLAAVLIALLAKRIRQ